MEETSDIVVIDVVNNLGNYQEIPVSGIVSELEYIPLQTVDECLIGNVNHLIVTSTHIFVTGSISLGNSVCYSFSRDGRFIGQIGRFGQGPGEYTTITGLSIDKKKQSLYIETFRSLLEYSWDGVFHRSINKLPNMGDGFVGEIFFIRDNLFIGHIPNYTGNEAYNFIIFSDDGQVIKSFDNHVKFERMEKWVSNHDRSMRPFNISQHIYVKEVTNDTLFLLNEQNELIPQFVFSLGKYAYPQHLKEKNPFRLPSSANNDVIVVPALPMVGTQYHIFFSLGGGGSKSFPLPKGIVRNTTTPFGQNADMELNTPHGIYDITNKTTRLLDTDPVSRMSGLINDLDGGLSFWPKYYTSDNELVDVWQSYDMKEFLTEEYFAAHEIRNPQAHLKLKELLTNLDWEDNPVIVIATLK